MAMIELKTEPAENRFKNLGFCNCVVVPKSWDSGVDRLVSFAVLSDAYLEDEDEVLSDKFLVRFEGKGQEVYEDDGLYAAFQVLTNEGWR